MASDGEDNDLEELLGRVSKKLGWQNIQHQDVKTKTLLRKPSESTKHRKKLERNRPRKGTRKSRKDTSSSSDKENNVRGHSQHNDCASTNNVKGQIQCADHSGLSASPLVILHSTDDEFDEQLASERNLPLICISNGAYSSLKSPPAKAEESSKDSENCREDTNQNSFETTVAGQRCENELGDADGKETPWELGTSGLARDGNQAEHSPSSNKAELTSRESPSQTASFFMGKTNVPTEEIQSPVPKINEKETDVPFSPLQRYSETPEPIKWLLTPPPKEDHFQARKSVEKVALVIASDSDSDSPSDTCIQTLSLSERLSKNFKKQKKLGKSASKKECTGSDARVWNSNSEDSDREKDGLCWEREKESAVVKERTVPSSIIPRSDSSDGDEDFESFLQAIKAPHHASHSSRPQIPPVDEDEYENSFIDDTPIDSQDSDDDVYYYRQINSDQKIFSDRKKEQDTPARKTPSFLNYRLPQFSDSDDADDDVFATPKLPSARVRKPEVSSSSKKFTSLPSLKRDAPTSSQTDFLSSLSTPKVGCTSSSPYVRDFKKHREALTRKLFNIYNQTVFDNKLPSDFNIKWNNRMRKTAGYCYYTKTRLGGRCSARIELSEKVCDTAERLRDTLIHELCHAACWLINGVNDGHGRFWKYWAAKANQAHPAIPVIKRCHSYEITTKYKYQCVTCRATIGRHSKSIDTAKFCCAYCKGNLVLLPSLNKDGKVSKARTPNKFAMFVKENYGSVKKGNTSMKHADIMRLLSQDFSKKAAISV